MRPSDLLKRGGLPVLMGYRFLRPGGYIELCDPCNPLRCDDGTLPEESALMRWSRMWSEGSKKLGVEFDAALSHKERLVNAGFASVVQREYKWPINTWPKDKDMKVLGKL